MGNNKSDYILAKFDVGGIQDYIFATNRLRENAGASYQVTRIMEEFLLESFREAADEENVEVLLDWKLADRLRLPQDERMMAEVIYIGGGNAVALFRNLEFFCRVGEKLGIKAAVKCQGVYLTAAYIETDLSDFAADRRRLDQEMNEKKKHMIRQLVYSPFPVVEQEDGSHQPITAQIHYETESENVTRIQLQKRNAYKDIVHYKRLFPVLDNGVSYGYPEEMDQLSREYGEDSMVAVVHIDGNGMGDRMNELLGEHMGYLEGVPIIRRESKKIAGLFEKTYHEVLQELWDCQVLIRGNGTEEERRIFPLRPILMDGDDFTFICRAELAVPIAAGFMMKLLQMQDGEEKKITACGGIAFVHSHFPFRVAYSIAEKSCGQAKNAWYEEKKQKRSAMAVCFLDFQVIKDSEVEFSLKNRNYQKRPYSLGIDENRTRDNSLESLYDVLVKMEEDWPSGRLHKMYRAFLEGGHAMEFLKKEFVSRGYKIDNLVSGRWEDSPLFDALEMQGMCRLDLVNKFLNIQ